MRQRFSELGSSIKGPILRHSIPIQKAYSPRMIDSSQMENAMSATAARAMTQLHCQQPSCSALTASHRDSAQSACLSARPSICLSITLRHCVATIQTAPSSSIRLSVRPSHSGIVSLPFHRSSAASRHAQSACLSVHPSICLFVTLRYCVATLPSLANMAAS